MILLLGLTDDTLLKTECGLIYSTFMYGNFSFLYFQQDDPFFSSDPFGSASFSSTTPAKQATEAFDPFGTGSASNNKSQVS